VELDALGALGASEVIEEEAERIDRDGQDADFPNLSA
jgi:hypothetical protein